MADRLKQVLSFPTLQPAGQPGDSFSMPHDIHWSPPGGGDLPQIPDEIRSTCCTGLEITATATHVTVVNQSAQIITGLQLLLELWHTHERAFGDVAVLNLSPKPFISGCCDDDVSSPVLGFGTGFLSTAATTGEGTPDNLFPWYDEESGPPSDPLEMPAPRAGTLKNLFVRHNTALPALENVTYTVTKNGVPTGLTVAVTGGSNQAGVSPGVPVVVAQGDRIGMIADHGLLTGQGTVYAGVVATMLFAP